jgi:hypothetical protein
MRPILLRSQIGISKVVEVGGGTPYVFTEQGVAMLSSVLRSDCAVRVSIEIMQAFVRLRQLLSSNAELSQRLDDMEQRYDEQIRRIVEVINRLMAPSSSSGRQIGFRP